MSPNSAVVLSVDTPIGLTVVRELARHGVRVHGVAHQRDGIGLYSRALYRGYLRPKTDEATVRLLDDIAARHGSNVLMAVGESDIAFVHRNSHALERFRLLIPPADRMARVLDKLAAGDSARTVGIDVPQTAEVRDNEEIHQLAPALCYPVILKWRNPHAVAAPLSQAGLPLLKAEYCYDAVSLCRALERYHPVGSYPLVQRYAPGYGLGQMIFMHQGEVLLRFQHRRVHEWPPEGGISTVCESVGLDEHAELFEKSIALLRSLDWEGPAMVEYRFDPTTAQAVFMEINGRFWGSLPLAYHAGAHFAWYTYSVLALRVVPPPTTYRKGTTCRFMVPETRRLLTLLFRSERIQNKSFPYSKAGELWSFLSGFFRPAYRFYVFSWLDPGPCLADLCFIAAKAARQVSRSLQRFVSHFRLPALRKSAPRQP